MCSTFFPRNPLRTTSLKNAFGSPPTTGGGEDRRPPVGPGKRWRHCGAIRDALDGILRTILGAGNGLPPLPLPHFCAIGSALRTSTAKPTAFTAGCGLVRHSASSPGTTGNVFWRRATHVSHARSVFADITLRCSPREPKFGARATMGCVGLEKSVRVRRRMEFIWSDFWTTWGRSSSLFPRRATRHQRGRPKFFVQAGPRSQGVSAGPT